MEEEHLPENQLSHEREVTQDKRAEVEVKEEITSRRMERIKTASRRMEDIKADKVSLQNEPMQ